MSMLIEIQQALVEQGQDLGPILLKLKLFASKLGSTPLQAWIKHEMEGYSGISDVPKYRRVGVSYTANFNGPFGSGIKNAPIPPYLIEKIAGEDWLTFKVRESMAALDALLKTTVSSPSGIHIEAGNLILILQGKVYEGYACNSVTATLSRGSLVEIQNIVRAKILELTVELENQVPSARDITLGQKTPMPNTHEKEVVTHITNQVIYGNLTTVSNSGSSSRFHLSVGQGAKSDICRVLSDAGISASDAQEFIDILGSEKPTNDHDPFGNKAKMWLKKSVPKALDGTWKIGLDVASQILTEAALKFYGLK